MQKAKKKENFNIFRIFIVKSSFFEVKTYEKLTYSLFSRIDIRSYGQSCRRVKTEKI